MDITLRQSWVALRLLIVMTVVLGIAYPVAIYVVGRAIPGTTNGSFVTNASGQVVGSALIGQNFDGPTWFHPRPSAAGKGYDPLSSGGTNLADDNPDLVKSIAAAKATIAAAHGVAPASIPADAVTSSGSGLDPDISPDYARLQATSIAKARHLDVAKLLALVDAHVTGRILGFIGEPRVNVLELNLALEQMR